MSRSAAHLARLCPWLRDRVETIQRVYAGRARDTGLGDIELEIVASTRSAADQAAAYKRGASSLDGVTRWSLHQYEPALACDLCPVQGPTYLWTEGHPAAVARWDLLGQLAEELGLTWGGRWTRPHDAPHVEVPERQRIILLQEALEARGRSPGPIDGQLGPRTLAALRGLESDAGLALTTRAMWWSIRPASWAAVHSEEMGPTV